MKTLSTLTKWWKKLVALGQNFLIPEDIKIQKLLDLPVGVMRSLLPSSPVHSKDIYVLFDYQNKIVRFLVKSIKYKNNANLRKRLAEFLYEEIVDISSEVALFDGAPPVLVPMPMSKKEKMNRGFNQCEELAREIKKLAGENIKVSHDTLIKVRETERQTNLNREERLKNVENSMLVLNPSNNSVFLRMKNAKNLDPKLREINNFAKNKTIIVLDDVYTTGASLIEARRALFSAGAKRVIGLFIAH